MYITNIILKFQIRIQIAEHKDNLLVENVFASSIVTVKTFLIANPNTSTTKYRPIYIHAK